MGHKPVAYSLVRLMLASMSATPRGIDRIDMGVLSHLFENWPKACFGVVPTLLGPRLFPRERVLRGRDRLHAYWSEKGAVEDDANWQALKMRLAAPDQGPMPMAPATNRRLMINRLLTLMFGEGLEFGLPMSALAPASLYLDFGHQGLTFPLMTGWLDRRPDVRAVFMIHDIIPLQLPELEVPETTQRHARALSNAARRAFTLLVPTPSVGEAVSEYLRVQGLRVPPVRATGLPLDDVFMRPVPADPLLADRNYFVCCGTLEPRKNQVLLLDVWTELIDRYAERTPHLVLAGGPGQGSAPLLARVQADPRLARHVTLATGLSSPGIAGLLAHARALLMPSLAEGFGLPPLEALALGTPALVSDIPAHRDAAAAFAQFLPPHEPSPWVEAIAALAFDPAALARKRAHVAAFRPLDWNGYFDRIDPLLRDLG